MDLTSKSSRRLTWSATLSLCLAVVAIGCGNTGDVIPDGRSLAFDANGLVDDARIAIDGATHTADANRGGVDAAQHAIDARAAGRIDAHAEGSIDAHGGGSIDARAVVAPDASSSSLDAASIDARAAAACGNGHLDDGEQCDNGAANSNTGSCLVNCMFATCGDGFVETGVEVCDDTTNGPGTCCASDCSANLSCSGGGINFDLNTGGIYGDILWNGIPTTGASGEFMLNLSPGATAYTDDAFQFGDIVPNDYDLYLYANECGSENLGALSGITVVAQQNTAADFDITNTAGFVTGNLTLNGDVLNSAIVFLNDGCHLSFQGGHFNMYLPPGDYTATVSDGNNQLGTVQFTSTVGQTTDTGTTDFEFYPGTIAGSITWNGVATTNSSGEFLTTLSTGQSTYPDDSYEFDQVPPSSYSVSLFSNECGSEPLTTLSNVIVAGGQTTTANFDITDVAGLVTGDLTLNGDVLNSAIVYLNDGCHLSFQGGHFDMYLPPGDYTATVSDGNNQLGTVQFTSVAGQTTATGTTDFEFHPGTIAGSVLWNGVATSNSSGEFMATLSTGQSTYPDDSYEFDQVPPSTYSLELFANECGNEPVGSLSNVIVAGGQTTTANFDITSTAGVVSGNLLLNGQPLDFAILYFSDGCHVAVYNGQFNIYLPPGSYSADVSDGNNDVGSFDFLITAGLTTSYDIVSTASGSNVSLSAAGGIAQPGGIQLLFSAVTVAGDTTVVSSSEGPSAPTGLHVIGLLGAPRYWQVSSSATTSGAIQVCTQYDPSQLDGDVSTLKLVDAGNGFTNLTTSVNTTTHVICGSTTTMSTFAVIDQSN